MRGETLILRTIFFTHFNSYHFTGIFCFDEHVWLLCNNSSTVSSFKPPSRFCNGNASDCQVIQLYHMVYLLAISVGVNLYPFFYECSLSNGTSIKLTSINIVKRDSRLAWGVFLCADIDCVGLFFHGGCSIKYWNRVCQAFSFDRVKNIKNYYLDSLYPR